MGSIDAGYAGAVADSGQAEHRFWRALNILLVLTRADGLLLRLYLNGAILTDHTPCRLDVAGQAATGRCRPI